MNEAMVFKFSRHFTGEVGITADMVRAGKCHTNSRQARPCSALVSEPDCEARTAAVIAGNYMQLATNLIHERQHDFHSESSAVRGLESGRQSRPVIHHRQRTTGR